MFVEAALGDAVGFGYEFAPEEFVAKHNFPKMGYVRHPNRPHVPGTYSDDTQMSIGLAMAMLKVYATGGTWQDLTPYNIVHEFVAQYAADPRPGS